MRKTRTTINSFGGYDYRYSISCDTCNEPLRDKKGDVWEFLTCGEDELTASMAGWIVEGRRLEVWFPHEELGREVPFERATHVGYMKIKGSWREGMGQCYFEPIDGEH